MRKYLIVIMSLFALNLAVWADDDKLIQVAEMPKKAQHFINEHFANQSVAVAKMEKELMDRNYDVIFTNGDKVEFDRNGQWTSVDCEHSQVPASILPKAIRKYIEQHYPGAKVLEIELTDRKGYELELDNGFELEFNRKLKLIDMDR